MPELDRITLSNLRFHLTVGILPHEREYPQPLEVDVTAWVTAARPAIVDYTLLHDAARDAVARSAREYLEEIAESVAVRALAVAGVARVCVSVRKPHVPLGGPLDYVEVTVHRPADA